MSEEILRKIVKLNVGGQRCDIGKVLAKNPMFDADIQGIDGRWLKCKKGLVADFASCNYLGFDLEEEVVESIEPALRKWGIHPSWCRLVASPNLYLLCEEALAELFKVDSVLILPTVTLIHIGVIPALMGKNGVMFLDKTAHMTLYQGAKIARDSGSILESFHHNDWDGLNVLLEKHKNAQKKLILVDGTYSMTGNYCNIDKLFEIAKMHDAILYIDDAHGVGVVGENPSIENPYGLKGNGVVNHFGIGYENIIYVGGLSKAYSSLAAFVTGPSYLIDFFKAYATPYDLSGPCPTASLQSLLKGIEVNKARGDAIRKKLYKLTRMAIDNLRNLGFFIDNDTYFPIISVWMGDSDSLMIASEILWRCGILVTLAPYPMVRRGEECLRITITAQNTKEQVERLLNGFSEIKNHFKNKSIPIHPLTSVTT